MSEIPADRESTLEYLDDRNKRIKDHRSTINEMWAVPSGKNRELDFIIHSELDKVTDSIEEMSNAYRLTANTNYTEARYLAEKAHALVIKSTCTVLDNILSEVRKEAYREVRFRMFRMGDWTHALDAMSEGTSYSQHARSLYERDDEQAIDSYVEAIQKFSEGAEIGRKAGFRAPSINVITVIIALIALILSLTPLGDIVRNWINVNIFRWTT